MKLYKDQTGLGLAAAKDAVEAMQAGAAPQPETGGDLETELLRLLGRGEKLAAVRLYKEQRGVPLVDAKQTRQSSRWRPSTDWRCSEPGAWVCWRRS